MDLQLQDRVALVVGGAGLIGSAVVERLRTEGAVVVVASRHAADGVVLDGRDDESVRRAVAAVLEEHGRIDALVVSAAPSAQTLDPARNSDPDQVIDAFDAKALVFLRIANAVVPAMRDAGYGRIVVLSGQNAFVTGSITGSVRNAATIVIAKNLADSLAGTGVAVTAVSPGIVSEQPEAEVRPGAGGQSSPEQIADLVAFLTSPLSAVSGESIAIGHRVRGVTTL
ncbi:SDR family NAD(P)-dependent oxidoreductase [Amnibacterium kyonggiense]|uniref:SDR family NAD(P)-dependent oxidoreductase n=1 Tax=Amnibacterium kyonggiense TaxID=595671 RepID=UPI00105DF68D|nr:SDR family oxidoreductase [Amnibacterium kyonggiense]